MAAHDEWIVGSDEKGVRLDKFLAAPERLGSRARAAAALARGKILLNGRESGPDAAGSALAAGDRVRAWMDRPGTSKPRLRSEGDLRIVYEDDALIVVDKPAGVLAVPLPQRDAAPSIYAALETSLRRRGRGRPFIVHRIDRDTSGLVVFATTAESQAALKAQFLRRQPERVYWAVIYGHLDPARGTWRDRLVWDRKALIQKGTRPDDPRGSEAISEYTVLESFREASLIEVRLVTGRRNQIRLQARLRGHPLVGEKRYIAGSDASGISFARQALHARRLAFRHPLDGRALAFESPLPADFAALLDRLRR